MKTTTNTQLNLISAFYFLFLIILYIQGYKLCHGMKKPTDLLVKLCISLIEFDGKNIFTIWKIMKKNKGNHA
jgi:hypothetical protein